ncbi:MAG: chemotaxis protein CheX [Candidatus Hydrogenedentes bacterium]|nr:chemotaxis protein CheX [Candidatus Hydrogenedentota bacterium]
MNAHPKSALETVFPKVLEEMAFLFADQSDALHARKTPGDSVCVVIAFTGARSGTLEMAISTSLGREISSNLLGSEPGETPSNAAAHDALGELLNVTCGNVLTEIAGDKPVFNLGVPRVTALLGDEWNAFASDSGAAIFNVEGQIVLTRITLHS